MTQINNEERILALEQHNSRMQKKLNMNQNVLAAVVGFSVVAVAMVARNQNVLARNQITLARTQVALADNQRQLANAVVLTNAKINPPA